MQIVIYKNGTSPTGDEPDRSWSASHVEKDANAHGASPLHVFRMLRDWLLVSLDPNDARVLPLGAVVKSPPRDPEDPDFRISPLVSVVVPDPSVPAPWEAPAEIAKLSPGRRARMTPTRVEPIHRAAEPAIASLFATGKPINFEDAPVPAGWDVRIVEGS